MFTREEWEKDEGERLAPWAMRSKDSRGRVHGEEEHSYRAIFQRDRDRIVHSTAFRRLEYKTQVFVNHEGDYYRTRLTHTIEVAQIARSIARTMKLNEDLTEAIALAHDLGHTPFGHSGEEALQELMKEHGGFEHNKQGLRVVDKLEKRYPGFKGLNLNWEVREGILKHSTPYDVASVEEFEPNRHPTLEAQVISIADEIAYNSHDLDDGLKAGILSEESLIEVELWEKNYIRIGRDYPTLEQERKIYQAVRLLIDLQVTDLLKETLRRLKELGVSSVEDVRNQPSRIVSFSPEMMRKDKELKDFLYANLYRHYRVIRMADKARRFIRELFNCYLERPEQLPPGTQEKLKEESPHRVVCDYIAGMTDRYALGEYNKLFQPYERV